MPTPITAPHSKITTKGSTMRLSSRLSLAPEAAARASASAIKEPFMTVRYSGGSRADSTSSRPMEKPGHVGTALRWRSPAIGW
jgi:hypothetical protein